VKAVAPVYTLLVMIHCCDSVEPRVQRRGLKGFVRKLQKCQADEI
jgi:hypothetical protein